MHLKSVALASITVALVAIGLSTQAAAAWVPCWESNEGASWGNREKFNTGVRSVQDIEAGTVSSGETIVHPMQALTDDVDFLAFATYRGYGTHHSPAITNCHDYYSSGWMRYIEGNKFGVYFCRDLGTIPADVTAKEFKIKYADDCNGIPRWKALYNGGFLTCQIIGDDDTWNIGVGGEVRGTEDTRHIDTHFDHLEYLYPVNNWWYSWNWTNSERCNNPGYLTRVIDPDDIWVEEQ